MLVSVYLPSLSCPSSFVSGPIASDDRQEEPRQNNKRKDTVRSRISTTMAAILRSTLFKIPDAENQAKLLEAYSTLKRDQVKVFSSLFSVTLGIGVNL
jgi:hypothetical protein